MSFSKALTIICICWLVFVSGFFLGLHAISNKAWPYPLIQEIKNFVAGDNAEDTTLAEKLMNDLNLKPSRHLVSSDRGISKELNRIQLKDLPLSDRRENPEIFISDKARKGFRIIYGVFDFKEHRNGAIILDSKGNVVHVWQITQEDVPWKHRSDANVYPHGFGVFQDGTILTGYDDGSSLTKYDYCGNIVWRRQGAHHHSVHFEDEQSFWVWGPFGVMLKLDYSSGKILKKIGIPNVMNANLDIDIFGIRQKDGPKKSEMVREGGGPFHGNDIEPLSADLEKHYPGFKAGDLLVSLRSPNLIFVMDQENLQVKWWRQGLTRRQHDPDWNERGTITIFNNNMHRKYSNILEIDPKTFESRILLDGKQYDFYSATRGKHQFFSDGGMMITSSIQGRVFEVDKNGDIVFEFINKFNEKTNLLVSEALFVPENFFDKLKECKP